MQHLGEVVMPSMTAEQRRLWDLVLELSTRLEPTQWSLVGGQMVALHALLAGVAWPRVTRDVDVLANMEVLQSNLQACTAALGELGLRVRLDGSGRAYRFCDGDTAGSVVVDLLAPDHRKKVSALWTVGGRTIQIEGGTQALRRAAIVEVRLVDGRVGLVPTPNLHGAIVLKAAAWAADSRDRDRHAQDVALLVRLIDDPAELVAGFAGSDRKRLLRLRQVLDSPAAQEWLLLGDEGAEIGHANWVHLTA
jgi:hypothetical protein